MNEFKKYVKFGITEMKEWDSNEDMSNVSVSKEDIDNGSPKIGDMIARNSNNYKDQWLINKDYFDKNYVLYEEK